MANYNLITSDEFNKRCEEEERSGRFYIEMREALEIGGKWCRVWEDSRTKELFAVEEVKSVNMGFNSDEDGKIDELIATVEKYGKAQASYGVTGRTCHELLAHELSKRLPQYDFEIGYNYYCLVTKKQ